LIVLTQRNTHAELTNRTKGTQPGKSGDHSRSSDIGGAKRKELNLLGKVVKEKSKDRGKACPNIVLSK